MRRVTACTGCGCPPDERTRGCRTCEARHRWRNDHAGGDPVRRMNRRCAGCGTEVDNLTLGCETCSERHMKRRQREACLA